MRPKSEHVEETSSSAAHSHSLFSYPCHSVTCNNERGIPVWRSLTAAGWAGVAGSVPAGCRHRASSGAPGGRSPPHSCTALHGARPAGNVPRWPCRVGPRPRAGSSSDRAGPAVPARLLPSLCSQVFAHAVTHSRVSILPSSVLLSISTFPRCLIWMTSPSRQKQYLS